MILDFEFVWDLEIGIYSLSEAETGQNGNSGAFLLWRPGRNGGRYDAGPEKHSRRRPPSQW